VGEVRFVGVQRGIIFVTVGDRPSSSRAGPLDRYDVDSVAARIARRTQESLFRPSLRAVNKKRRELRHFNHFFSVSIKKIRDEMIPAPEDASGATPRAF